jgi:hypothetical protein
MAAYTSTGYWNDTLVLNNGTQRTKIGYGPDIGVRKKVSSSTKAPGKMGEYRMLNSILKRAPKKEEKNPSFTVTLDKNSRQRLKRLKRKLRGKDEPELIAFGLQTLEQKADRVIRKIAVKRVRSLERKGRTPDEIARELNRQQLPVFGQAENWRREAVLELLDKKSRDVVTNNEKRLPRRASR